MSPIEPLVLGSSVSALEIDDELERRKEAGPDLVVVQISVGAFAATERQAIPDLQNTIEDQVAEGNKVATRFRGCGTHTGETEAFGPPTGNSYEVTGTTFQRFDDEGKIVEDWTIFDALGMIQQLGFIPEGGQAGS
jgi:SnoaL-like polyketide cyclase